MVSLEAVVFAEAIFSGGVVVFGSSDLGLVTSSSTTLGGSGSVVSMAGASISHSFTVLSPLAEANTVPSDEKATEVTGPVCSRIIARWSPVAASQSRIVWSSPPEARQPWDEKATERTASSCPSMVTCCWPVAVSQMRTVPSQLADARRVPSWE